MIAVAPDFGIETIKGVFGNRGSGLKETIAMRLTWYVRLATLVFLLCVFLLCVFVPSGPSLSAQDFLKQLEAKLSQKQQEAKNKEQPPANDPIELPGVLEPEGLPAPELLPDTKSETTELPSPVAPIQRATKPAPTSSEPTDPKPSRVIPSPFPPKSNTKLSSPNVLPGGGFLGLPGGGFLGLTVESIPGGGFGLTVVEVVTDSPAWKAGFRNGDRVVGVAGQAVSTTDAFEEQLKNFGPGSPVKFLVERRGRNANLTAVLQDRAIAGQIHGFRPGTASELSSEGFGQNPNPNSRPGQAYFGVNVSDMSDAYRKQFSIPAYRGASVTEVVPNSPAHSAGLKPGDCIVEIDGTTVQSAEVVFNAISRARPGQLISFSFYRGRQLLSASVPLANDREQAVDNANGGFGNSVSPDKLTADYVTSLHSELERVNNELAETQARLQQLEARLQRIENKR